MKVRTNVTIGDLIAATLRVIDHTETVYNVRSNGRTNVREGFYQVVADVPAHEYFLMGRTYRTEARTELCSVAGAYASREAKELEVARRGGKAQIRFQSGLEGNP